MSEERKTIQINPELFKVSNNKTPKKREKPLPRLNIKPKEKIQKQKTLRKNVLKMIREKQQEEYKRLFDKKPREPSIANKITTEFDKNFDETIHFFSSLAKKTENEESKNESTQTFSSAPITPTPNPNTPHNTTLKQYLPIKEPLHIQIPEMKENIQLVSPKVDSSNPIRLQPPLPPKYGCLKNGSLPTYRSYQQTIRNREPITTPLIGPKDINTNEPPKFLPRPIKPEVKSYMKKNELFHNRAQKRIRYLKRKKIYKRTYRVGKQPKKSKISVLISNKTVRNRLSTQAQLLKQTPMNEIRQFLIKKGFIKVGSNTPNDVLRKMYESVSMVCGEVQNHNSENLLYNFLHDKS